MGLNNAWCTASAGTDSHFFVVEGDPSNTAVDQQSYYGLPAKVRNLQIHRVPRATKLRETLGRGVYKSAIAFARERLDEGGTVLCITRELGLVPALAPVLE